MFLPQPFVSMSYVHNFITFILTLILNSPDIEDMSRAIQDAIKPTTMPQKYHYNKKALVGFKFGSLYNESNGISKKVKNRIDIRVVNKGMWVRLRFGLLDTRAITFYLS